MDNRIEEYYEKYMDSLKNEAHDFGLLYFDHLYSEYMSLRPKINPESQALMDGIHKRRVDRDPPLTWNDIYLFDLELLEALPPEDLSNKASDMRSKYRNVVGEKEYQQYLDSKPPDVAKARLTPPFGTPPGGTPPTGDGSLTIGGAPTATITDKGFQLDPALELALREDIKYLLKVFYLNYSLMKVREGVRAQLIRKGVVWTLIALAFIAVFITANSLGTDADHNTWIYRYTRGLTLGVVLAAGCVGGLMSMLQRLQSAPSDGDALFHLASLSTGWRTIFLAPLTGAVFAVLMFVLFAGGVLKGTIFPDIYTPNATAGLGSLPQIRQTAPVPVPSPSATPVKSAAAPTPTPTPTPTPSGTESAGATPLATPIVTPSRVPRTPTARPSATVAQSAEANPTVTLSPSPESSPTPSGESGNSVALSNFIQNTGPSSGVNYALLIIWSFLAGFAERLVPDTLTKMVAKSNL